MRQKPKEILHRWITYVNGGDLEKIVSLYNSDSVLLPTFSPDSLQTPQKLMEYFRQLSERENLRVDLHDKTLHTAQIDRNRYIIHGIYCFHFTVDDVSRSFPSRFTFVLDTSSEHPILHHHSSRVPRTLP